MDFKVADRGRLAAKIDGAYREKGTLKITDDCVVCREAQARLVGGCLTPTYKHCEK